MSDANSQNQCRKQCYIYKSAEKYGHRVLEVICSFSLTMCVGAEVCSELKTISIKAENNQLAF